MTKLINMKGVVALAMALSFCVFSVVPNNSIAPNNSTIVSEPITYYEARDIEGGALPVVAAIAAAPLLKIAISVLAVDAVLIAGSYALYVGVLAAEK